MLSYDFKDTRDLVFEAIIVGILTIIFGYLAGYMTMYTIELYDKDVKSLPQECKKWNKHNAMEISLFLTGFLLHVVLDIFGTNKWYCDTYKRNY
jgi:cytosine/uracil/thiamine/allantoin permease